MKAFGIEIPRTPEEEARPYAHIDTNHCACLYRLGIATIHDADTGEVWRAEETE